MVFERIPEYKLCPIIRVGEEFSDPIAEPLKGLVTNVPAENYQCKVKLNDDATKNRLPLHLPYKQCYLTWRISIFFLTCIENMFFVEIFLYSFHYRKKNQIVRSEDYLCYLLHDRGKPTFLIAEESSYVHLFYGVLKNVNLIIIGNPSTL